MSEPASGAAPAEVLVVSHRGVEAQTRLIAEEAPVSLEFNGLAYAVMMATPTDLEDFAVGFALSEGAVARADEIQALNLSSGELGWFVRMDIAAERMAPIVERARRRVADGGCGLCGVENLEQAMRTPRAAQPDRCAITADGIFRALSALRDRQALNAATGAVHAAALCAPDGEIRLLREDVGRHNAFDKLIGAMARLGLGPDGGFALLSSRCSYELVDKALNAGIPALVTVSAATTLASSRARAQGLTLVSLARADAFLVMNDPAGRLGAPPAG